MLSEFDANVAAVLPQVADLVSQSDVLSQNSKIAILKAIATIEFRSSIAVNEDYLLDQLIAEFHTHRRDK